MSAFRRFTRWVGSKFERPGFPDLVFPAYEERRSVVHAELVDDLPADTSEQVQVRVPSRDDFIAAFSRLQMSTQTRQLLSVLERTDADE